ncbi:MAG: response regulator [Candidatus Sumerlaeia bacterium]|nr:response regulator [Candidatus Sumerlaeia bacterium]
MPPRILCVDDEPSIRLLFEQELSEEGYDVDTASGGQEAIEKILKQPPDLMLLDIRMEDMTGLEVLQAIRPELPDLPVIMVTAVRGLRDDFSVESDTAVVDYITKPVDLEDLRAKVKKALAL